MKTKLLFLLAFLPIVLLTKALGQTALAPGDIAIFHNQTDIGDDFTFVTFVDLLPGTVIYFTDCGADAAGFNVPCTEGAYAYTVPAEGHTIGDIIKFMGDQSNPVTTSLNPNFAPYNDAGITNLLATSTAGDQILVFQETGNPGEGTNASANPSFIFASNTASTAFTGDKTDSNQTGLPVGLQDTTAPVTALGLGAGPGPQDEWDNVIYNGSFDFSSSPDLASSIAAAKLALTNPANYYATNTNPPGDASYNGFVAAIPNALMLFTLSTNEFAINNNISLYPNPAKNYITISNSDSIREVIILDITGKIVIKTTLVDKQVDISKLNSGVYLVNLLGKDVKLVKKFIKQ